ncbi:MAG: hypothetical protein KatS3mg105_2697 [Gemmatales bacterium]|nr:MAG: hypothetical protein KatS3mg105_2697 [Gemmatales bacterium]
MSPHSWQPGDRVLALWPIENYWYPATVLHVDDAEGIQVAYDDGDKAVLRPEHVRPLDIEVGDVVYARPTGESFYVRATILERRQSYVKLVFDNGQEENTTLGSVRVIRGQRWQRGDRVFAPWEPEFLYPGTVQSANDEFVVVAFDDGDQIELPMGSAVALELSAGDLVFSRYQGGAEYLPAVIRERNGDELLVEYEDGETEWTTLSLIRLFVGAREF